MPDVYVTFMEGRFAAAKGCVLSRLPLPCAEPSVSTLQPERMPFVVSKPSPYTMLERKNAGWCMKLKGKNGMRSSARRKGVNNS